MIKDDEDDKDADSHPAAAAALLAWWHFYLPLLLLQPYDHQMTLVLLSLSTDALYGRFRFSTLAHTCCSPSKQSLWIVWNLDLDKKKTGRQTEIV